MGQKRLQMVSDAVADRTPIPCAIKVGLEITMHWVVPSFRSGNNPLLCLLDNWPHLYEASKMIIVQYCHGAKYSNGAVQ